MLFAIIGLALLCYAIGWRPDWQALWTGFVAGLKVISFAPLSDWRAALKRFALACGIILLLASLWSPLPGSASGTHAALEQAIRDYQVAHGLNVDGVWGPKTNTYYVKGL